MVRAFQRRTQALRYAPVPVVVAPAGLTLGGGCEIALHGDRVQAAAETYIGLVEVGVGLIPAGGGTKEMLARARRRTCRHRAPICCRSCSACSRPSAFAKVSTSAADARQLGYLRERDRDHDEPRAADRRREGARARARPRRLPAAARRTAIPVGGDGVAGRAKLGVHLAWRAGRISDHDAVIGRALAHILAGGSLPHSDDGERSSTCSISSARRS